MTSRIIKKLILVGLITGIVYGLAVLCKSIFKK